MDIQTRKIKFVQHFLELQNEEVIEEFEKLMESLMPSSSDDKMERLSVEELNDRVAESEMDYERGNYKTSEDLLSKYRE